MGWLRKNLQVDGFLQEVVRVFGVVAQGVVVDGVGQVQVRMEGEIGFLLCLLCLLRFHLLIIIADP